MTAPYVATRQCSTCAKQPQPKYTYLGWKRFPWILGEVTETVDRGLRLVLFLFGMFGLSLVLRRSKEALCRRANGFTRTIRRFRDIKSTIYKAAGYCKVRWLRIIGCQGVCETRTCVYVFWGERQASTHNSPILRENAGRKVKLNRGAV